MQVGFNINSSNFFPMPLPSDPMSRNIPASNLTGTVQATDLMIAIDGVMKLYSDVSGTHIYVDITIDGNIINNNLQEQIDIKSNQSATYTKRYVDNSLALEANQSTTYTKT